MTLNSLKFPIIFIFATLSATAKLSSSSPIENNDVQLVKKSFKLPKMKNSINIHIKFGIYLGFDSKN